jgi:hypothetical protein
MGFFNFLNRRQKVTQADIPRILQELGRRLAAIREQFNFGVLSALKGEGVNLGVSPLLNRGGEADSALRGFQLINAVGFSWDYMDESLYRPFDLALTGHLDNGRADSIRLYRESYLDCRGNMEEVSQRLAADLYRIWGDPVPRDKILNGLTATVPAFAMMTQADVASTFGDKKRENDLRDLISK